MKLVAKNCARTAGITSASQLALGEIAIIVNGKVHKTGTDKVKMFQIAIGLGNDKYKLSQPIETKFIGHVITGKVKLPELSKVVLGDDGTGAGIFTPVVDQRYSIEVKVEGPTHDNVCQIFTMSKVFKTGAKLVDMYSDMLFETKNSLVSSEKSMSAYLASSTATVSTVTGSGLVFTNNSDYVVATSVASLTVGDFIKVDGKLYKIEKVDTVSKTVKLAWPYKGVNKTVANPTIVLYSTLATTDTAKVGIVIEGIDVINNPLYGDYYKAVPKITNMEGFTHITGREVYGCHPVGLYSQVKRDLFVNISPIFDVRDAQFAYEAEAEVVTTNHSYSFVTIMTNALREGASSVAMQGDQVTVYLDRGLISEILTNHVNTTFLTNISEGTGLSDVANSTSFVNVLNSILVNSGLLKTGVNTIHNGGGEISATGKVNDSVDI